MNSNDCARTPGGRRYWNRRNRVGQFVRAGGTNRADTERLLGEWRAYLDARYEAAEAATRGVFVARSHRWPSPSIWDFLRRGGQSAPRWASQEFRDWLSQAGPTLGFRTFCDQAWDLAGAA